ncbi:MAG: hypothetical protein R3B82_05840 [Sandaracinaceae bacterium]
MRALGLALGLLALGCGPQRVRWEPQPTTPDASSFGLVWVGTPFHLAPDPRAPTVSLAPPGAALAPWLGDTFVPVRVLAERRGWARVETLGPDAAAHCVPEAPGIRPFRLRLYIESRALSQLTVREVGQRFDDGTSAWIARGVPLERLPQPGFFRIRLGEMSTVLRLEPSAVGTRYLPSEPRPEAGPPAGRLSYDALRAGVPVLGQTGRVHSSVAADDVLLTSVEPLGAEALVTMTPRCAELRVRVPIHLVGGPADLLSGTATPEAPTAPFVEPGTPIFWPGGREAGTVVERIGLDHEVEGDAERRCFGRALHGGESPNAVLCFRRADLGERGAAPAAARGLAAPE